MKKALLLTLIFVVLLSLVGCSNKTKLEPGETFVTFEKNSIIVSCVVPGDDAEDDFRIRMKDSSKEIRKDLEDYFSDIFDDEYKITEFKKGKDYISFTYELEDIRAMGFFKKTTLKEYAEDFGYDDLEEMAEYNEFILYSNEKSVDEDDLEEYEDEYVQIVFGGDNGTYYKFPNKILLVSDGLKYKKISNDTIYIKRNSIPKIIVYKK